MSFSKQAFELRKLGDLKGALQAARAGMAVDRHDGWNQRALGWVLYDLIKKAVSEGDKQTAKRFFDEANSLNKSLNDDTLNQQLQRLAPKVSILGEVIEQAEKLFKSELFEESLEKFRIGIADFSENEKVHEQYGWCIYKLLRKKWAELNNLSKRKLFKEYLDLKNPRPSLLHSQFLNQAAKLSDEGEIKLFEFLKLWGPQNLMAEDWEKFHNGEKEFPALIDRILRRIFQSSHDFNLSWLEENIGRASGSVYFKPGNKVFAKYSEWTFWELWRANKEGRNQDLNSILQNYRNQGPFQPSEFHSKILEFVAKKVDDNPGIDLVGLLLDVGFESFRQTDFTEQEFEGKKLPSIAEKVSQKAAKLVIQSEQSSDETRTKIATCLDAVIEKVPKGIWLFQNRGKLNRQLGNIEDAIWDFKQVVKFKSREYWAWEALGDCLEDDRVNLKIACYCKALSLKNQEGFIVNLRLKLAKLLIASSFFDEAKTEIEAYFRRKEKDNSKISQEAIEWRKMEWFEKALTLKNNFSLYKDKERIAVNFVYEDLPWISCNLLKRIELDGKRNLGIIGFSEARKIHTFSIRFNEWETLKNTQIGLPLQAKIEIEYSPRRKIGFGSLVPQEKKLFPRVIEPRDGSSWDSIEKLIGVVDHINYDKGIAHVLVSKTHDCLIHLRKGDDLDLGQFVAVRMYQREKETKIFNELLTWEISREKPSDTIYYEFSGKVSRRESQSFAFVSEAKDIFISPDLVKKFNLVDGDIAQGVAILFYNKRKGSWGWKCIKIS